MESLVHVEAIDQKIKNFDDNIKKMDATVTEMVNIVNSLKVDNSDITPLIKKMGNTINQLKTGLHEMVNKLDAEMSQASAEIESQTRNIESTLG